MKKSTRIIIPIVFIFFSLLYIILSFSIEQRKMIGDEMGWDPGSRAMPIGIGFLMLGVSIYLFFKERKSGEEEITLDSASKKLIIITIMLSILYILFFRFVGFILSTNVLLFTLIYFYYKRDIKWNMMRNFSIGLLASTGTMILFYSIGRFVTHFLFLIGGRSNFEIFSGRLFMTGVTFLVLLFIFFTMLLLFRKAIKNENFRIPLLSGFITIGVTEFIYIIFKQIFWVSLAKGLIFW